MEDRFGRSFFKRVDLKRERLINKEKMVEEFSSCPPSFVGGIAVKEVKTIDGVKFVMEDGSWLLLRPSGTEPKMIEEGLAMARKINV